VKHPNHAITITAPQLAPAASQRTQDRAVLLLTPRPADFFRMTGPNVEGRVIASSSAVTSRAAIPVPELREQPRSSKRLFAAYAAITLVPVLVLGIVLANNIRAAADRRGLAEGISRESKTTRRTTVSVQWAAMSPRDICWLAQRRS
jgi:hypothetical protein